MAAYQLEKLNRVFLKFSHETFKLRAWNKLGISPADPETGAKSFLFCHNNNKSLLTKLVPSRWLDIDLTFSLTSTSSQSRTLKKELYPAILTSREPWSVMHMWPNPPIPPIRTQD